MSANLLQKGVFVTVLELHLETNLKFCCFLSQKIENFTIFCASEVRAFIVKTGN